MVKRRTRVWNIKTCESLKEGHLVQCAADLYLFKHNKGEDTIYTVAYVHELLNAEKKKHIKDRIEKQR